MEQASQRYKPNFDSVEETPFSQLLARIISAHVAELFDYRADRTTIANWRAGRRNVPLWAIERARERLRQIHGQELAIAERLSAGPGKRAGAKNLARYLANKNRYSQTDG